MVNPVTAPGSGLERRWRHLDRSFFLWALLLAALLLLVILVFIPAMRELSSIVLSTTGTQVLSVLLFDKATKATSSSSRRWGSSSWSPRSPS